MPEIFETFKPKDPTVSKYVDYYYLDIKPNNEINVFECFPHYNNSISLYKSHSWLGNGEIAYAKNGKPLQIFTPVRENVLHVKQVGVLHRVVIVFHVLGIQRFFRNVLFNRLIHDFDFFAKNELDILFATADLEKLNGLLDKYLLTRFHEFDNPVLEKAIAHIFTEYQNISIENLAVQLNISRRHLSRIFRSHTGVSVKKFHEIVLFRKTMEKKLFISPEDNFSRLAHEFNFSDQAHMNKTFRSFTQNTPKQFFKGGTLLGKEDTFWHLIK